MTLIPTKPKQTRSKRTEQALLKALDDLLYQKSFSELTVAEIAIEAGLTTGAIYRRFENKEALFAAVIKRAIGRIDQISEANRAQFDPKLPDGQLVMNMLRELFQLTFHHVHIMRAANYVFDPAMVKELADGRNAVADWFSRLITSSSHSDEQLQNQCRFIFRMAMAVYFDTLLSSMPAKIDRHRYLKSNQHAINRLQSDLQKMCCSYLGLQP